VSGFETPPAATPVASTGEVAQLRAHLLEPREEILHRRRGGALLGRRDGEHRQRRFGGGRRQLDRHGRCGDLDGERCGLGGRLDGGLELGRRDERGLVDDELGQGDDRGSHDDRRGHDDGRRRWWGQRGRGRHHDGGRGQVVAFDLVREEQEPGNRRVERCCCHGHLRASGGNDPAVRSIGRDTTRLDESDGPTPLVRRSPPAVRGERRS
jgi:hypothetical protein